MTRSAIHYHSFTLPIVVVASRSGNGAGRIDEVTLRRIRLVLGWVTVFGRANRFSLLPTTQANSYRQWDAK